MKFTVFRIGIITSFAAFAGCASVAVSNDAIEQNTAFTLGVPKGSFTISDRVDDGVKSTYVAKTNTGKQYNCYVTGAIGITGRVVSDAICQPIATNKSSTTRVSPAASSQSNATCNALLKAAGKC